MLLKRLAVGDLSYCAVLVDMNVQSIRIVVHGHHATVGVDDAVVLREIFLRETRLVRCTIRQFLAHEFGHPGVGGRGVVGVDAGDDERHCEWMNGG